MSFEQICYFLIICKGILDLQFENTVEKQVFLSVSAQLVLSLLADQLQSAISTFDLYFFCRKAEHYPY